MSSDLINLYGFWPAFMAGTWVTIKLAIISLFFATILGLLACGCKLSSNIFLKTLGSLYTTLIRGIPDLVLMLLFFYGGQIFVNNLLASFGYEEYLDINPFISGSLTIGLIFGAYLSETFRGAFLSVPKGQIEAGLACGMSNWVVFKKIGLPQMARHALPGFGNNWLVLVKSTAIVSVIGLDDVVRKATLAGGSTQKPFVFWMATAAVYLIITSLSTSLQSNLKKRLNKGYERGSA